MASDRASVDAESTDAVQTRRWDLHRRCVLTPMQSAAGLSIPLVVSSVVAAGCASAGYPLVAVFALIEWLAAGAAFVWFARHVHDGESVTLLADELVIEMRCAERTQTVRLNTCWLRVDCDPSGRQVECRCGRDRWSIGRHVAAPARRGFALELARELRSSQQRTAVTA
jgi:uncharacterized membrane protein